MSSSLSTLPTATPQPSMILSSASIALIVVFLSLCTLAVLVVIIGWIRRRRTTPKISDERPSEKEAGQDVEALAANRPIVPVTPLPDVRWVPQIRSISGPAPDKDQDKKPIAPPPKRARSPPPSNVTKPRNLALDLYPKSAPAYALSFAQDEMSHQTLSPPVTPHALAASGMETRSLGRPGFGSKS